MQRQSISLHILVLSVLLNATLITITNAYRRHNHLQPLTSHPSLTRAARAQAQTMCTRKSLAHSDLAGRLRAVNFVGTRIGENIARSIENDEERVFEVWMQSEMHRDNIMGDYEYVGVGRCVDNDGYYYYVEIFGKRLSDMIDSNCDGTIGVYSKQSRNVESSTALNYQDFLNHYNQFLRNYLVEYRSSYDTTEIREIRGKLQDIAEQLHKLLVKEAELSYGSKSVNAKESATSSGVQDSINNENVRIPVIINGKQNENDRKIALMNLNEFLSGLREINQEKETDSKNDVKGENKDDQKEGTGTETGNNVGANKNSSDPSKGNGSTVNVNNGDNDNSNGNTGNGNTGNGNTGNGNTGNGNTGNSNTGDGSNGNTGNGSNGNTGNGSNGNNRNENTNNSNSNGSNENTNNGNNDGTETDKTASKNGNTSTTNGGNAETDKTSKNDSSNANKDTDKNKKKDSENIKDDIKDLIDVLKKFNDANGNKDSNTDKKADNSGDTGQISSDYGSRTGNHYGFNDNYEYGMSSKWDGGYGSYTDPGYGMDSKLYGGTDSKSYNGDGSTDSNRKGNDRTNGGAKNDDGSKTDDGSKNNNGPKTGDSSDGKTDNNSDRSTNTDGKDGASSNSDPNRNGKTDSSNKTTDNSNKTKQGTSPADDDSTTNSNDLNVILKIKNDGSNKEDILRKLISTLSRSENKESNGSTNIEMLIDVLEKLSRDRQISMNEKTKKDLAELIRILKMISTKNKKKPDETGSDRMVLYRKRVDPFNLKNTKMASKLSELCRLFAQSGSASQWHTADIKKLCIDSENGRSEEAYENDNRIEIGIPLYYGAQMIDE